MILSVFLYLKKLSSYKRLTESLDNSSSSESGGIDTGD